MKILIVSDTHGRDENLEKAVYREEPFDYLIHCGDVEGREIFIEALVDCPCCIVSGNNDFFSDLPREEIIDLAGEEFNIDSPKQLSHILFDVLGLKPIKRLSEDIQLMLAF